MSYTTSHRHKSHTIRNRVLLVVLLVAAICAVFAILELMGVTDFYNPRRASQYQTTPASDSRTVDVANKGEAQPTNQQSTTADVSQDKDTNATEANIIPPTGTFVSNHRPNLSGAPSPNLIQSTCKTNPGATCQIFLKNGATTKSLPAQNTDSTGSAYWTWKLQDLDISEGSWEIEATSTLNGHSATSKDSLNMEVLK